MIEAFIDAFVYLLPLIVCLIIVGFCLWVINHLYGEDYGRRI